LSLSPLSRRSWPARSGWWLSRSSRRPSPTARCVSPRPYSSGLGRWSRAVWCLSGPSLVKGLSAAALGALVALIGLDPMSGVRRFAFGTATLLSGVDFIAVIIGLFAVTEVLVGVEEAVGAVSLAPLGKLMPRWD